METNPPPGLWIKQSLWTILSIFIIDEFYDDYSESWRNDFETDFISKSKLSKDKKNFL